MQLLVALATGAAALVAPTQRALPKTVRHFNFGDFGKSKDYASAQEKIRSYDNTQTVETAKYGKRAIRATQLNGQNVLNPEPACAAFIAFAAFECYLSAQACALAASRSVAPSHHASSPGVMDVGGFLFDSEAPRRCGQEFGRHLPHLHDPGLEPRFGDGRCLPLRVCCLVELVRYFSQTSHRRARH